MLIFLSTKSFYHDSSHTTVVHTASSSCIINYSHKLPTMLLFLLTNSICYGSPCVWSLVTIFLQFCYISQPCFWGRCCECLALWVVSGPIHSLWGDGIDQCAGPDSEPGKMVDFCVMEGHSISNFTFQILLLCLALFLYPLLYYCHLFTN